MCSFLGMRILQEVSLKVMKMYSCTNEAIPTAFKLPEFDV